MADALAIRGGIPVRTRPWPSWPRSDDRTAAAVTEVLTSTRWALSGPSDGRVAFERRFAHDFADFNEVAHCTPVTSGTAALTVALQALGVGPNDEVIVPGLTWVACASAVLHLGGRPVLADIDPATITLDPARVAEAITGCTRAIMVVHFANSVADLDVFTELSARTGIPLVEDCAQAHGARWRHRRVGTFGRAGCFSMQQSKLLTAGEGGAVVTGDNALHDRMEQLRSDGRRVLPADGNAQLELVEAGDVLGRNFCLSELQAAVLQDRLRHLDDENEYRRQRAKELFALLDQIPGVRCVAPDPRVTAPTYYNTLVRLDPAAFAGRGVDLLARAIGAELGEDAVHPTYIPLNRHRLLGAARGGRDGAELPVAEEARRTCVTLPHRLLLEAAAGMPQIAAAFAKVQARAHDLAGLDESGTSRAF